MSRNAFSTYYKAAPASKPDNDAPTGYVQVFPVAHLREDFDGVPRNGAEYLAAMQAQAQDLPWGTIAKDWYQEEPASPSPPTSTNATAGPSTTKDSQASRHPALPTESWIVSFDGHFVAYREYISTLPAPRMPPQYDVLASNRSQSTWLAHINGARRKKLYHKYPVQDEEHTKQELGTEVNEVILGAVEEEDEEAMMNAIPTKLDEDRDEKEEDWVKDDMLGNEDREGAQEESADDDDEEEAAFNVRPAATTPAGYHVLEPERERHKPGEPLVKFVRGLCQDQQLFLIEMLTSWLTTLLDAHACPPTYISTQPSETTYTVSLPGPEDELPLPPHWAKWIFAILCCIPGELTGDEMYLLREMAKVCRNIVRWQVTSGALHQREDEDEGERSQREKHEAMRQDCWMIHQAVIAGWAQRDLAMDAQQIFAKMMSVGKV